ncbi:MAG: TlpA disulfide reductase family protein [Bacteroidota bacterium]
MKSHPAIVFTAALLFSAIGLTALTNPAVAYHISGQAIGKDGQKLSLRIPSQDEANRQIVEIKDGKFEFSGSNPTCEKAVISYEEDLLDNDGITKIFQVFLEKEVELTALPDSLGMFKFLKGRLNIEADSLNHKSWAYYKGLDSLYTRVVRAGEAGNIKESDSLYNLYKKQNIERSKRFYEENLLPMGNSIITVEYLYQKCLNSDYGFDDAVIENYFSHINVSMQNSFYYKGIEEYLRGKKMMLTGKKYIDTLLQTPGGKSLRLSSAVKGKTLVLLDFWASWCSRCRYLTTQLTGPYQKYKSKGFEIVSISIDENSKNWLRANANDSIPWISLRAEPDIHITMLYNTNSLPLTLLVDQNGVIIAKNIKREELIKILDSLP